MRPGATRIGFRVWIVVAFGWFPVQIFAADAGTFDSVAVRHRIQGHINVIESGDKLRIGDAAIVSKAVVPPFYRQRDFGPAWLDSGNVETLIAAIHDSYDEGLRPSDYHLADIERLRDALAAADTPDPNVVADLDLVLTDALLMLGYHHLYGKVDPESIDSNWNIDRPFLDRGPVEAVERALTEGTLDSDLQAIKPRLYFYTRLRRALAEYRRIQSEGGLAPIPSGKAIRPGDTDARIHELRRLLLQTRDLAAGADSGLPELDEALESAVRAFQRRHRLTADGIVGRNTIAAMNVPVARRIDQIRINMERARWYSRELETDAVFANIAGFTVYLVRDDRIVWTTRSMVGKLYRKTPLFKAEMTYVQFNPTWTVPPGILRKDILPKAKQDPSYLAARNIDILDRQGQPVDPAGIDWPAVSARNFPYVLRQQPGPTNALGRVKFIFPNGHFVFMHDTPHRGGFAAETRTFSSGCIRIDKPLELAEKILDDPEAWSLERIQAVVDSTETRTVHLNEPIAVYLTYWTAAVDDDGEVHFRRDVYDRDAAVLDGLESRFSFARSVRQRYKKQKPD